MIIGASHISISATHIEDEIENYIKKGFSLKFIEHKIDNHTQKKPFLNQFFPKHSIAVLSGKKGIDIELVQHSKEKYITENINIKINFGDTCVNSIEYIVNNLDRSVSFWEKYIGFQTLEKGANYCMLEKKSLFPQWNCKIRLLRSGEKPGKTKLDGKGATALAFISTNLEIDLDKIKVNEYIYCSEIFDLSVNTNKLRIAFIEGPSNEIIELIEFQNE